jgi:hypothetical protein
MYFFGLYFILVIFRATTISLHYQYFFAESCFPTLSSFYSSASIALYHGQCDDVDHDDVTSHQQVLNKCISLSNYLPETPRQLS